MTNKKDPPTNGLWAQFKPLIEINAQTRPLSLLFIAALAIGLPVLVGAALDLFSSSVLASMGGLVILYMNQAKKLSQRITILAACSVGFLLCFLFGTFTSFNPFLSALTLAITAFLATVICRFYRLPPPGSFFFIMVACVSRALPYEVTFIPERAGILLAGCLGAILLGLLYALFQGTRSTVTPPITHHQPLDKVALMLEAGVIASFIGGGYLLALMIGLDNPYWVPISTAAIMQGATFQKVWHRNVHRIVGTMIGMGLAWLIFSFSPNPWILAWLIMILSFLIEALVTRNYGLAVIFMTPLTVIFAEVNQVTGDVHILMVARMMDIVLGSLIGYLGGWLIHHQHWFRAIQAWLIRGEGRQL